MLLSAAIRKLPFTQTKYRESGGYYGRIPVRIGPFLLKENTKEHIVFETTNEEFCSETGPKMTLIIRPVENGWEVQLNPANRYGKLTPAIGLEGDSPYENHISQKRAFWHAAQYMSGNKLSPRERVTKYYQTSKEMENGTLTTSELLKHDAFFDKHGNPVTTDPFGPFLKN